MLHYILKQTGQITNIDIKVSAETEARESADAVQQGQVSKLKGDVTTLGMKANAALEKAGQVDSKITGEIIKLKGDVTNLDGKANLALNKVGQQDPQVIGKISKLDSQIKSINSKFPQLIALPDELRLTKANTTRAMNRADQAFMTAIQTIDLRTKVDSTEALLAITRNQLMQARISSWFWNGPEIATGEDTDGAGTNGGGIVAGGVDLATHQYDDGDGTVSVLVYDHGTTTWEDLKTSSNLASWTNNYQLMPDAASEEANDAFAVGWDNIFPQIAFDDLATGNGQLATYGGDAGKWQYSDGQDSWADLTVLDRTDTTAGDGLQTLQQTGAISFLPPSGWVKATYNSLEKYWIRWVVTAAQITQEAIIDDTNKDEPFVVIPDSNNFVSPVRCYVNAITLANHNTVHDQAIKFIFGEFTSVKPSEGQSFSAQQTWTASKAVQRFDLSAQRPVLSAGGIVGAHIQDDASSTNNPIIAVGMEITLI